MSFASSSAVSSDLRDSFLISALKIPSPPFHSSGFIPLVTYDRRKAKFQYKNILRMGPRGACLILLRLLKIAAPSSLGDIFWAISEIDSEMFFMLWAYLLRTFATLRTNSLRRALISSDLTASARFSSKISR
jgi:hypothetical protein